MMFNQVSPGADSPDVVNVIIEIPAHSDPVKYEVDKESGAIMVDRFMSTAMHYPCNYGYIPQTLCGDGDPADVLVIAPFPLLPGCVISCRAIGLLAMEDEKGEDHKILAVPSDNLCRQYQKIKEYNELSETLLNSIVHFFEHYKDLEEGKWVKTAGWKDAEAARKEIAGSMKAFVK